MVRVLVVLFWLGLIVGTYATGNVLGNWVVCLLALFFFIRARRRRQPHGPLPDAGSAPGSGARGLSTRPLTPSVAGMPQAPSSQHPARPRTRRWR
jgi:hypothetical protein